MPPQRTKAIRDGLFVAGLFGLAWIVGGAYVAGSYAPDARAYWVAAHGPMYGHPDVGSPLGFYYAPPFQQVLWPLLQLPYETFLGIWYLISCAAVIYVSRWWLPFVLLTAVVPTVIIHGNVEILMALAIVVGFRWPSAWAFILFTKVLPGVGLLWFAVRREWTKLAIALGTTAVIAGVSFLVAPGLWFEWVGTLLENSKVDVTWPVFSVPPLVRLPIAAAVVAYGATRGWRWSVALGATIATPVLWPVNMSLLIAAIPLLNRQHRTIVSPAPEAIVVG